MDTTSTMDESTDGIDPTTITATPLGVVWTVAAFALAAFSIVLSIRSARDARWKGKGKDASNWKLVFATAMFYLVSSFLGFVTYLIVCIDHWQDSAFWIFQSFYSIATFMAILVWMKRLESVFTDSVFELSVWSVRSLQWLFYGLIIVGTAAFFLFFILERSIIVWVVSGLWVLMFIAEIGLLLALFVSKLHKLKVMAEFTLQATEKDEKQLIMVQKIFALQVKLTILALTTIFSTTALLAIAFSTEDHLTVIFLTIDSFIGFVAVFCSLKTHDPEFYMFCRLCLRFAECLCRQEAINVELARELNVIQSRTSGNTLQAGYDDGPTMGTNHSSQNSNAAPSKSDTPVASSDKKIEATITKTVDNQEEPTMTGTQLQSNLSQD